MNGVGIQDCVFGGEFRAGEVGDCASCWVWGGPLVLMFCFFFLCFLFFFTCRCVVWGSVFVALFITQHYLYIDVGLVFVNI
jgi:hypothetical protein